MSFGKDICGPQLMNHTDFGLGPYFSCSMNVRLKSVFINVLSWQLDAFDTVKH